MEFNPRNALHVLISAVPLLLYIDSICLFDALLTNSDWKQITRGGRDDSLTCARNLKTYLVIYFHDLKSPSGECQRPCGR